MPGSRPRLRASSTVSAMPNAWVEQGARPTGSGLSVRSRRWIRPGWLIGAAASTTTTAENPLHSSIRAEHIAAAFEDANPGGHPPAQPAGDRRPKAVVAAVRIADRGDEHAQGPIAAAHVRFTRNVRKCAAQEMHGSWLRMLCSQLAFSASSSRSRPAVATCRKSSSITPWFCAVGGTRRASRTVPSASSR